MSDNSEYNQLRDAITIGSTEAPDGSTSWPHYNFSNWQDEIFHLVRDDEKFERLVRSAVTDYLISAVQDTPQKAPNLKFPPPDWDIWNGAKSPWEFGTDDYWPSLIMMRVNSYLINSDDLLAKSLSGHLAKFDDGDDREALRIYSALDVLFEPTQDSSDYFKIRRAGRWLSVPVAHAIQLLRPSHDIKILTTGVHSCVLDLTGSEVFDICREDSWKENSVGFALTIHKEPVAPQPAPVRH